MAETATVEIQMPAMGESVSEGTVLEWHVAEGDTVEEGQTVVEVSTDKVDAEVPAPTSGTVTKILAEPDEEVDVGAVLAEIKPGEGGRAPAGTSGEAADQADQDSQGDGTPPDGSGGGAEQPAVDSSEAEQPADHSDAKATPVAKRIAADKGIDLSKVNGSGAGGKITKEDVLATDGGGPATEGAAAEAKPST